MGTLVPQLNPTAGSGVLFLVYTAGLMFVLRTTGSGICHTLPLATLVAGSILIGAGLHWLGGLTPASGAIAALTAATVFGIGKAYFWPTMLGITADQFPRGGALLISLMGAAGMLSVAFALPIMGAKIDEFGGGAAGGGAALQMMSWLGAILTVIFTGLWFYFRAKGGYRVVHLSSAAAGE